MLLCVAFVNLGSCTVQTCENVVWPLSEGGLEIHKVSDFFDSLDFDKASAEV